MCLHKQASRISTSFILLLSSAFALLDPVSIVAVDNVDQNLRILVVMMSQRAQLVLTPNGPQGETKVLTRHVLHIGIDRYDGRHHLATLHLEEDRDLSSSSWSTPRSCQSPPHMYPSQTLWSPAPTSGSSLPTCIPPAMSRLCLLAPTSLGTRRPALEYEGARTRASSSPTCTSRPVWFLGRLGVSRSGSCTGFEKRLTLDSRNPLNARQ